MPAVTSKALNGLTEKHHTFFERLNALLDLCGVVEMGSGRQKWIAHQGNVTVLAVKGWEKGSKVRDGNLNTLSAAIVRDLPVKCSQQEIVGYLQGSRPDIDVAVELKKLGLPMPTQVWFLNLLNEEVSDRGMNPTEPEVFGIWSATAIKSAQYYTKACAKNGETPDETKIRRIMGLYIELCLEGALDLNSL